MLASELAMARRNRHQDPTVAMTREETLCHRAARLRRRGDDRQSMQLLKAAAHENTEDPKLWVLYGVQCTRLGRFDTAVQALSHAAWLRDRAGEPAKARVTRELAAKYSSCEAA
jgi:Flp pilus assembly protein TadD